MIGVEDLDIAVGNDIACLDNAGTLLYDPDITSVMSVQADFNPFEVKNNVRYIFGHTDNT